MRVGNPADSDDCPCAALTEENDNYKTRVASYWGDYRGEWSNLFPFAINQLKRIMKKRIILHLVAIIALMPCILIFDVKNLWLCAAGCLYSVYLWFLTKNCSGAKKFLRDYYHEILRIENGL